MSEPSCISSGQVLTPLASGNPFKYSMLWPCKQALDQSILGEAVWLTEMRPICADMHSES